MLDADHVTRKLAALWEGRGPIALTPMNVDAIRSSVLATLGELADQYDVEVGPAPDGTVRVTAQPKKSEAEQAAIDARTREIAEDLQRLREIGDRYRATASKP